jgi:recombination endonuclease VII
VSKPKPCIDCTTAGRALTRPAPFPGPRCATDWRAEKAARKTRSAMSRVEKTYGITGEQYEALYDYQGRRCWICRRATGATKRLSVDHNHRTGEVRGLLCDPCNNVLAHLRDRPAALFRAAIYLIHPPSREALRSERMDEWRERRGSGVRLTHTVIPEPRTEVRHGALVRSVLDRRSP